MKARIVVWIGLVFVLTGCKENAPQDVLNALSDQSVVAGKELTITFVSVNDSANFVLTTDGAVGPNKDPYAQSTPAVFDASAGTFTWTPTDAEAGLYSVQFTAMSTESSSVSQSRTITITVYTPAQYGVRLFGEYCAQCHGADANGGTAKSLVMTTRDAVAYALSNVPEMTPLSAAFTEEEIDWLGLGIASLRAQFAHADVEGECEICHDGMHATGKNVSHVASTNACAACHNTVAWKPVIAVDHAQVIGTCVACHDGVLASGPNTVHTFSDTTCGACHTTDAFVPAIVDHEHVLANTCGSCHSLSV